MDIEWWKPIPGYEGYYAASTKGRVRNLKTGKILKQTSCGASLKYRKVGLHVGGVRKLCRVHKLVWITFVGEIPEGTNHNRTESHRPRKSLHDPTLLQSPGNNHHRRYIKHYLDNISLTIQYQSLTFF